MRSRYIEKNRNELVVYAKLAPIILFKKFILNYNLDPLEFTYIHFLGFNFDLIFHCIDTKFTIYDKYDILYPHNEKVNKLHKP